MPVPPRAREAGHFVVYGDDALAYRLVEELTARYSRSVTVVLRSRRQGHGPRIVELPGVRVVEADPVDRHALRAARLDRAAAIAVVGADDLTNLRVALVARETAPRVRLVVKFVKPPLVRRFQHLIGEHAEEVTAIADAALVAPDFVAAALGADSPQMISLAGGRLAVARRREVAAGAVLCPLASGSVADATLLPEEADADALVLAFGLPEQWLVRRGPTVASAVWTRVAGFLRGAGQALLLRRIHLVGLALGAVLLAGTVAFALAGPGGFLSAAYVTVLTAIGGGEPDSKLTGAAKAVQVLVTVLGTMLVVPAVAAAVNAGRRDPGTERASGHVVLVGLGAVGTQVMTMFTHLGMAVVAVERDDRAQGLVRARRLGVPVVAGDATDDDVLDLAGLANCVAVVAVTADDLTNLQVGLAVRERRPDTRTVLRLADDDLASQMRNSPGAEAFRSTAMAAAAGYAAALLGHSVVGTIPVGRRLLLVAQVPVVAGDARDGATVGALTVPGAVAVIGVSHGAGTAWRPAPDRVLAIGDKVLVVATRQALAAMLA